MRVARLRGILRGARGAPRLPARVPAFAFPRKVAHKPKRVEKWRELAIVPTELEATMADSDLRLQLNNSL